MLCWRSWSKPLMLHFFFARLSSQNNYLSTLCKLFEPQLLDFLHQRWFSCCYCIFLLCYQILAVPLTMFPLLHIVFPFCYTTCAFVLFDLYLLTYLYFFYTNFESLWAFEKLSFERNVFPLKIFFLEAHFCYRKVL